jgi:hypothetical protein
MNEESKEESPTLICLLPGTEEGTIIVGASFGLRTGGSQGPAHWSALALLPLLAKSLISVRHRCTLKLVAFPGREHGTRGATWYVSQLTEAQRKTNESDRRPRQPGPDDGRVCAGAVRHARD